MIIDIFINLITSAIVWLISLLPERGAVVLPSAIDTILTQLGSASIWTKHMLPHSFPALLSAFWIMLLVELAIQTFFAINWVANKLRGSG